MLLEADDLEPGQHLDKSREQSGALRATIRDRDNKLVGSLNLTPVDPESLHHAVAPNVIDSGPENNSGAELDPALAILGGLALVGLAVTAVSAVSSTLSRRERRRELEWRIAEARRDSAQAAIGDQRVAAPAGWYDDGSGQLRWWDGQDWTQHYYTASPREGAPAGWYDDGSGRQRWWDGQDWTQHYQDSLAGSGRTRGRTPALSSASSNDVERDYDFPAISLSRAQWEDQVRVMMQARMISELQWRVLSNARIEDADPELLEWQGRLRTLTAQEFSRSIDSYVASHPEQTLELAAAGWYDDGSGRQRWWDGLEWTGYFQTDESRMLPVR